MTAAPRIPDASLSAYVDGRLSPRAERDLRELLDKDPAMASRAANWRRQSEALRAAFLPIADEPLSLSILLKLRAAAPVRRWGRTRRLLALAFLAGLACGVATALAVVHIIA